jgi:exonuclease III
LTITLLLPPAPRLQAWRRTRTRTSASHNPAAALLGAIFPAITFFSQNCNSLNLSTCCQKQIKKLFSIVSCGSDIILLSNVRLGNGAAIPDQINTFRYNKYGQYDFYHNSTQNRRGVGILIKHNLNYSIEFEYRDNSENILGLLINIDNFLFRCVSVYGPNNNDRTFFNDINHFLSLYDDRPVVLGGDWNMTVSTHDGGLNIDTINMLNPPSLLRSRLLLDICSNWELSDPFRTLHPETRDFTYVPRAGTNNRSRIDFFLVSNPILNNVNKCSIGENLLCTLFDHKPICLEFCPQRTNNTLNITNKTLNHPRFPALLAAASVETYLHHARRDPELINFIDQNLVQVGRINYLIRQINDIEWNEKISGQEHEDPVLKANIIDEIDQLRDNFPDPSILDTIPLSVDPDIFFEVLTNNIMNTLRSFQGWLNKLCTAKKADLINRLVALKMDYQLNTDIIFQLEAELNAVVDSDLRDKTESPKIFENLNSEKPTPLFLNLTKTRTNSGLEKIKNNDGVPFPSDGDREEFIVKSFQDLYETRPAEPLGDDAIDNFLGPDIANSDIVRNSKLTDPERANLELPLSLAELDISVNRGKTRSAPGMDGYSNALIKKCWKYFRRPLLSYANHCYNTGTLTHNFRSARIRLIPKKGDHSMLKNWRPISLLSNLYKIISRAVNIRLNKIVNRICSRAQKGYNNVRYTQEVLINTWERINYCRRNGIRGAVVAIDMAKAFDTLSHDYVDKVYAFFNIGPNMRRWLSLIGSNRCACINFGPGRDSRYFPLGRGRPQGDNVSPNSFNFSIQILIFKLELDPLILPIPKPVTFVNHDVPNHFRNESNGETSKNESLADDNTTFTLLEEVSLQQLRNNLISFERLSGLACNFDKTCVMPMLDPTPEEIALLNRLNLKIVDKVTLLGVEISRSLETNHTLCKAASSILFSSFFPNKGCTRPMSKIGGIREIKDAARRELGGIEK